MSTMMRRRALLPQALLVAVAALGGTAFSQETASLVRLTPEQYERSIHDIFGADIDIDANKVDPGFRDDGLLAVGNRRLTLSAAALERDDTLAQQIAAQVADPHRRATLVGCAPSSEQSSDDGCIARFVARVGLPLFRRPLSPEEVQGYVTTAHQAAERLHSFDAGIAAATAQMLVAPDFLFRIERSTADAKQADQRELDGYSRAARLSFFLWNTTPDGELLASAQTGKLMTPQGLQQQVDRMLNSVRLESGLRAFFIDMLAFSGLDEDPGFDTLAIDSSFYPNFTLNAQNDAQEQTLRTIVDHLLHKNGDYRDLFTTRDTFLTPALAALYGVPLARSQELGGAVPWVPYHFSDDDPYAGILTEVSFLSLHSHPGRSSPTRRGKALREIFLCQKVPPPPGNVDFSLVQNTNDPRYKTVRQRLTVHRNAPMCAGCHKITDPIGLSFENFDTAGEFRTSENGAPIDASGDLSGKGFDGIKQLTQIIRDDPATTACLLNRAYSYGTERKPTPQEQAWLATVQSELSKDGVRWRELMRRITLNPDFYSIPSSSSSLSASTAH